MQTDIFWKQRSGLVIARGQSGSSPLERSDNTLAKVTSQLEDYLSMDRPSNIHSAQDVLFQSLSFADKVLDFEHNALKYVDCVYIRYRYTTDLSKTKPSTLRLLIGPLSNLS